MFSPAHLQINHQRHGLGYPRIEISIGTICLRTACTPQESIQQWQDTLLRLENCQSFHLYKHFTPVYPFISPPDELTRSDAVIVLLSIITSLERPLRESSILLRQSNCTGDNLIDMSRVNKSPPKPKFLTACSSLEALTIKYVMDTDDTAVFAAQLIRNATRVQRLSIDADYSEHSTTLMSQLYSYSTQHTLSKHIRELTLKSGHVGSSHAFAGVLASLQHSLTKVSFAAVHLDSGDWASVLRALSELPLLTDVSTWVLRQPGFQRVHFPAVLQDPIVDSVLGTEFSYTVKKLRQGQTTLMVAYSGCSMDIALQKLADFATPYRVTG